MLEGVNKQLQYISLNQALVTNRLMRVCLNIVTGDYSFDFEQVILLFLWFEIVKMIFYPTLQMSTVRQWSL